MTEFYAPDGGYADLPGGDDPGSTVPLDCRRGRVLRFTTDEWDRRAAVAEQAAVLIAEAVGGLRIVAIANDFGDCVEGRSLHFAIKALTDAWYGALLNLITETSHLSKSCRTAANQLPATDSSSKLDLDA